MHSPGPHQGGRGGSGVVIIRRAQPILYDSGSTATDGDDTVHTFTSSGRTQANGSLCKAMTIIEAASTIVADSDCNGDEAAGVAYLTNLTGWSN